MKKGGSTVLIVDNDQKYRALIKDTLETLGCRILEASNRDEALLSIEARSPNLVLIDMRLVDDNDPNDRSGLKLLREIPGRIPTIVLTADPNAQVVRDAYQAIPDTPTPWAYLFKVDGLVAIRAQVQEALQAHRPSAKPWYKERTFIVVAVILGTLILGGGLYLEFKQDGPLILGILAVGVVIEVIATFVVKLFDQGK